MEADEQLAKAPSEEECADKYRDAIHDVLTSDALLGQLKDELMWVLDPFGRPPPPMYRAGGGIPPPPAQPCPPEQTQARLFRERCKREVINAARVRLAAEHTRNLVLRELLKECETGLAEKRARAGRGDTRDASIFSEARDAGSHGAGSASSAGSAWSQPRLFPRVNEEQLLNDPAFVTENFVPGGPLQLPPGPLDMETRRVWIAYLHDLSHPKTYTFLHP